MDILKKVFLLFVSVLLVACSADEKLVTNALVENEKPQTISAELNFSVIQEESSNTGTRGLNFNVLASGAPKLNLDGKQYVTVHCVFYHTKDRTFSSAPLRFRVVNGKSLVISQGQKFNLTLKKDVRLNYPTFAAQLPTISEDEWYMMGIVADKANANFTYRDAGHHNGFALNDTGYGVTIDKPFAQVTAGQSDKVDLDIPFAFLWRKLKADVDAQGNYVFTAEKPALVKPMGTIIRLNITNQTNYKLKYNGFTFISSGSTGGAFVLDLARYLDTQYQAPASKTEADANADNIATAYKELVKAMWVDNGSKKGRNGLSYTNYKFKNETDVHLDNNAKDPSTYWVWFIPQEAPKGGAFSGVYKGEIQKTQFLLHSKADQTDAPEMAMLPVYGAKELYVNGKTYPANGVALYNYGPLNFVASENCTASGGFSNELTQAKQFSQADMGTLNVPEGYHIPTRMEWQTIFARYAGMGYMQELVAINPGTLKGQNNRFAVYVGKRNDVPAKLSTAYQHIVTMSKWPKNMGKLQGNAWGKRFRAEPETGFCWQRDGDTFGQYYTDKYYGDNFNYTQYPPIQTDEHKSAIRIDYVDMSDNPTDKARLVLTQRYLGPNFVLTPYDIQDDRYWKETGRTDLHALTDEFQRSLPMYGFALNQYYNASNPKTTAHNFGLGAIYWSNTEASTEKVLPANSTNKRLPLYLTIDDYSSTDNLGGLCDSPTYTSGSNAHGATCPAVNNFSALVRLFTNEPQKR